MRVSLIRFLDILFATAAVVLFIPILIIILLAGYFDTGSPIFMQERVGRDRRPFTLIKFRTMSRDTRSTATHLVDANSVTRFGAFLRRTKLDELPQLFNVVKGDMSLVGPRPCLFSQNELIDARDKRSVFKVRPGITGLAQINQIDMSTPELLAQWDARMIENFRLADYFSFILKTLFGAGSGDKVRT